MQVKQLTKPAKPASVIPGTAPAKPAAKEGPMSYQQGFATSGSL